MNHEQLLNKIQRARQNQAQRLNLKNQKLKSLPAEIGELTLLEDLDLENNLIKSLPSEISHLTNLKKFSGRKNAFKEIPVEILSLPQLEILDMKENFIQEIPGTIKALKSLKVISVGQNPITSLAKEICELTKLETLSCGGVYETSPYYDPRFMSVRLGRESQIRKLPTELGNLTELRLIYLNGNSIDQIPESIGKLRKLRELHLRYNQISSIPKQILDLNELVYLDLRGNLLPIPIEILEKVHEPQIVLNYYFKLVDAKKQQINESKLTFLGQGSVGKTSLVRRLLHNVFNIDETKTEGISINRLHIANQTTIDDQSHHINLNVWDFGGQEIMHATHQFFLTKRSLYLLVLDSRLTQEENRVEYWLKIIQSFGGESPVLIVGNKIDQHPLDIDRTGLQKKYPNIVGIVETSAATGAGIEELKASIAEQVNNLPHVRDLLPETWFTVKTKLEKLGRESNFITHDKYLELCAENEVSDETSQRTLIGFLHDLGVVLHFQDDPRLEALGILNPQWVTNGVYKILNSHTLFQNKGVLTTSMLDEILNLPEYPRGKRLFIVDMMKKFELCYDIEPDKTFLVPDLLPKDEPAELKFNGIPAFEYAYPVLPSSVITRFIVRMNQKIDDGFVWRTGVVLKIGENHALVKADIEDRKITIAIDGLEHTRRDALSAIRYELGEIHNSIKGLNPQQRVPIPNAPSAEPLEYDYLLMLEREGDETCRVKDGNRLITVNVRQILSAIENEAQRKNLEGSVIIYGDVHTGGGDFSGRDKSISASNGGIAIGRDVTGNIISGDDNQIIQDSYNKIKSADIQPDLKQTLKELVEAVETMNKSLPEEQSAEVTEDLGKLVDEATKSKPNKKWYSVSIEGLIKAAENLDKLGEPVINLSQKVLSLLTGGAIK